MIKDYVKYLIFLRGKKICGVGGGGGGGWQGEGEGGGEERDVCSTICQTK